MTRRAALRHARAIGTRGHRLRLELVEREIDVAAYVAGSLDRVEELERRSQMLHSNGESLLPRRARLFQISPHVATLPPKRV